MSRHEMRRVGLFDKQKQKLRDEVRKEAEAAIRPYFVVALGIDAVLFGLTVYALARKRR